MLRDLARKHTDFVSRTAAGAGVPPADIGDVAQTVLLILWQRLQRGELTQVRAWLGTVTRRVAWAHNRAEKRHTEQPGGDMAREEEREAPSADEIHESMASIRLVHEVLGQLDPARRVILERFEIDGESMVEIAGDLRISVNTGHSRLRLAREDFQRLLEARLRRDERPRRAMLLPFFFQQRETPPSRPRGRSMVWLLLVWLVLLAVLVLDTRWDVLLPADMAGPAPVAAGSTERTEAPAAPSEHAEARAAPSERAETPGVTPSEPAPTSTSREPPPGAAPLRSALAGVPAGPGAHGSPLPSSQPRKRRNLEAERILLDTADRMAAEGQSGAVKELLLLYAMHAPDNPMPATRAAVPVAGAAVPSASSAVPVTRAAVPVARASAPAASTAVPVARAAAPTTSAPSQPSSPVPTEAPGTSRPSPAR